MSKKEGHQPNSVVWFNGILTIAAYLMPNPIFNIYQIYDLSTHFVDTNSSISKN